MVKINETLRYDGGKLMSYNRILNFVNGARGLGKTYFFKRFVVKKFIENGDQFIYVRRNKSDLKKIKQFFEDLKAEGFLEGHTTKVLGRELYIDNKLCGWALPLSAWQSEKSTAYPRVKTVIYDEFLLEKSNVNYIPNEVESFLNLLDTIIRTRDDVRVFCLSNATTIVNPYYLYFNIAPDVSKRFNKYENMMVEIPDSKDFSEVRKETAFGKLIQSTDYARMSLNNEFTQDTDTFIGEKPTNAVFNFIITVDSKYTYGVWFDPIYREYYISKKYNGNALLNVTANIEMVSQDIKYVRNASDNYGVFKVAKAFKNGLLYFESVEVRTKLYDFFKAVKVF